MSGPSEAEEERRQKEAGARPEIIPKETPEERAQRERKVRERRQQQIDRDRP